MAASSNTVVISQSIFQDAAKSRDAALLLDHLRDQPLDQDQVEELADLVRRSGALIHQRPDVIGQHKRDSFLADLRIYLLEAKELLDLKSFDDAVRTITIAEDGFHRILAFLARSQFAGRPADVRAAAIIARMEANLRAFTADMEAQLRSAGTFSMPGGAAFRDANGQFASSDGVISGMVDSLGGTLLMEGYANGWFDPGKGWLVLPVLQPVIDADILLAGQSEYLSTSWRRWTRLCDVARYLNSPIYALEGEQRPTACPEEVTLVYAREADCEIVDYVANERAVDREGINALKLAVETSIGATAKGIDGPVAAAPAEWVSPEEAQNMLALSEMLGYEVLDDQERPGGLRLAQWVRGFTVLSEWVKSRAAEDLSGVLHISQADLLALLQRGSLSASDAQTFLDAASFGRKSRDLFDTPIVRTAGEWLLVSAPLTAPRLSKIIPSLLSSMKIQLKRKGSAFEKRVIELLKKHEFDAKSVKVTRDGAEYDYDILFPWGEYVFHFECKNHGLSCNDPMAAHHFLEEIASGVKQVQRLRGGLEKWPEILTDKFGPEVSGKPVISCILQNETYCIPGGADGVYVYDWSALGRFFESSWLHVMHDHRMPKNTIFRNRVGLKRIWSGDDKPMPDDLITQFEEPSQFRITSHHLEIRQGSFQIDDTTIGTDWFLLRHPITTASMAESLGVPGEAIESQIAKVDAEILALKSRLAEEGISD